jgi:hypothetical protein
VGDVPYGTITSLHESPMRFGMLAAGTDDGRLHVSRDGGYTWTELPFPLKSASPDARWWVAEVLWSHHVKDRLYVALNGHRLDDATPQVFVTETDGRTWTRVQGLPAGAVNALAESADRPELLVVGSDSGCFLSLDRGATWTAAHPDLPPVPVHDLVVQERENELVIGPLGGRGPGGTGVCCARRARGDLEQAVGQAGVGVGGAEGPGRERGAVRAGGG